MRITGNQRWWRRLLVAIGAVSLVAVGCSADTPLPAPPTSVDDQSTCVPDLSGYRSIARVWNEATLDAIRRDFPAPTVHARNLFHLSVAMWDTWAAFEPKATGHLVNQTTDLDPSEREAAINAAAHRLLMSRYDTAVGAGASLNQFDDTLTALCGNLNWGSSTQSNSSNPKGCLRPPASTTSAPSPASSGAALGIEIADEILCITATDGANAASDYEAVNPGLVVEESYTTMVDPNRWQPLDLIVSFTQNEQELPNELQEFVSPHWGSVTPFALDPAAAPLPLDPGPPPLLTFEPAADQEFVDGAVEVIRYSAGLDPTDDVTIDIGPRTSGNNPLGTNNGDGYDENPISGNPYLSNEVLAADFGRAVAEFWADGPSSETPPGHWNTLANVVSDEIAGDRVAAEMDRLEWDVKLYLALNGATHDAAIAAWGAKAHYDYSRPISMIRYLAGLGQSTDPTREPFHPSGLPLIDDLIRIGESGEIEIRSWQGVPLNPVRDIGGVDWIRAGDWVPYQLPTFVTPAFASYVSGHSAFSRAAAEILSAFTGDEFFPGGLGQWRIEANSLQFENGPTEAIPLQWATYFDAADQAGLSRLYGGIHVTADDLRGREIGSTVGIGAWERALMLYGSS